MARVLCITQGKIVQQEQTNKLAVEPRLEQSLYTALLSLTLSYVPATEQSCHHERQCLDKGLNIPDGALGNVRDKLRVLRRTLQMDLCPL
eukprot:3929339-Amphidinium_carterae.1